MQNSVVRLSATAAMLGWCAASSAALTCDDITHFLSDKAVGVVCFKTDDLRPTDPLAPPDHTGQLARGRLRDLPDGGAVPLGVLQASTDPTVISIGPTPTLFESARAPGVGLVRRGTEASAFPASLSGELERQARRCRRIG